MSLIDEIDQKYKDSLKEKDSNSINTLRLIKSAIKDKEISLRSKQQSLEDKDIISLLQSLIKQRKDSIEAFDKANRKDLIKKEQVEIEIIQKFLPSQKSEEETRLIIIKIIEENKFSSIKDMGNLMNKIKSDFMGEIDMGIAGKIAKTCFTK